MALLDMQGSQLAVRPFLGFSGDVVSENNVGIIVGAEYDITEGVSLNVEGRFIDESASTGSLRYRF